MLKATLQEKNSESPFPWKKFRDLFAEDLFCAVNGWPLIMENSLSNIHYFVYCICRPSWLPFFRQQLWSTVHKFSACVSWAIQLNTGQQTHKKQQLPYHCWVTKQSQNTWDIVKDIIQVALCACNDAEARKMLVSATFVLPCLKDHKDGEEEHCGCIISTKE